MTIIVCIKLIKNMSERLFYLELQTAGLSMEFCMEAHPTAQYVQVRSYTGYCSVRPLVTAWGVSEQ